MLYKSSHGMMVLASTTMQKETIVPKTPHPPKPPVSNRDALLGGIVFLVLIVGGFWLIHTVFAAAQNYGNRVFAQETQTTTAQSALPQSTTAPAPTVVHTAFTTVLHDAGTGDKLTQSITVGDLWPAYMVLTWKCDHSSDYGYDYNVIIRLVDANTGVDYGVMVNSLCESGQTSGTYTIPDLKSGEYKLQILSEGWWDVTVQGYQPTN